MRSPSASSKLQLLLQRPFCRLRDEAFHTKLVAASCRRKNFSFMIICFQLPFCLQGLFLNHQVARNVSKCPKVSLFVSLHSQGGFMEKKNSGLRSCSPQSLQSSLEDCSRDSPFLPFVIILHPHMTCLLTLALISFRVIPTLQRVSLYACGSPFKAYVVLLEEAVRKKG